jgi:MFS family permease
VRYHEGVSGDDNCADRRDSGGEIRNLEMLITQGPEGLSPNARLLFSARILRMFGYGLVSVILVLYLIQLGLSAKQVGALLTLTLWGDTLISLGMTITADRVGRRKMLVAGAILTVLAGFAFVVIHNFWILLAAAIIGVISPSGNEVGPFLPIEQAALAQTVTDHQRTRIFSWYNLIGSFATATGALIGGILAQGSQAFGFSAVVGYQSILLVYGGIGLMLAFLFSRLSSSVEAQTPKEKKPAGMRPFLGLHQSRQVILKLSALFTVDAFAGGFVMQSLLAYWFHVRFGVQAGLLGGLFFGANLLAGISALSAARIAARFGLLNTMVFTHIPSNLLLILIPLMPNLPLAIAVFLSRFALSQMDVPTRQSYMMAVVQVDERSAAGGVAGLARTLGAGLSPVIAGPLFASPSLLSLPFFLAGSLKIGYDLMLYRCFRSVRPPEECKDGTNPEHRHT